MDKVIQSLRASLDSGFMRAKNEAATVTQISPRATRSEARAIRMPRTPQRLLAIPPKLRRIHNRVCRYPGSNQNRVPEQDHAVALPGTGKAD
jgi:hypothetical protein